MLHDGKQASQFLFVCVIYNIYLIYIHVNIFFLLCKPCIQFLVGRNVVCLLSVVMAEDFQHQLRVSGSQRGKRTGRVLVLFRVGPLRDEVFTRVILLFLAFSTNSTVHLRGAGEGGKHWKNKQGMKSVCNRSCVSCRLLLFLPSRGAELFHCKMKDK